MLPSTSKWTLVTRPVWPAKTGPGRRRAGSGGTRTRLPRATGTPLIRTASSVRPDAGFRLRLPPAVVPRRCRPDASARVRHVRGHADCAGRRAAAAAPRGHRLAAVDDRGRPRIRGAGLGLFLVGQGQHPQREDLVDLGGVVQRHGAFRGHRRVVVENDRATPAARRSAPSGPASTGQQRCWRQRAAAACGPSGGSSSETKSASCRLISRWVPMKRPGDGVSAGPAGSGRPAPGSAVAHRHAEPRQRSADGCVGAEPHVRRAAADDGGPAARPAGRPSSRRVPRRPAGRRPPPAAPGPRPARPGERPQRDLVLHGLVPAQPAGGRRRRARPPAVNRPPSSRLLGGAASAAAGSAGGLPAGAAGRGSAGNRRTCAGSSPDTGVRGARRAQDAELPAGLVLLRGRPVGVEQIALVEDGVGDGAGQAAGSCSWHRSPATSRGAASRLSTAASQEVRPRADLYCASALPGRRGPGGSSPLFGKYCVHQLAPDRHRQPVAAPRGPRAPAPRRSPSGPW